MARKHFDNVRHAIGTTGTGDITLGSVPNTWQSFADAGAVDGDQPGYRIEMGTDWEEGYLTLDDGVTTAARTVVASTNADAALDLDGSAVLTCVLLAGDVVIGPAAAPADGDVVLFDEIGGRRLKSSGITFDSLKKVALVFVIDGGGAPILAGPKAPLPIPFGLTITGWTILGNHASGSIVIDLWKDTYANYPPLDGDSITASALPTVTTAAKNTSTTLTGWTTALAAGDGIIPNVDSNTNFTRVTLLLHCVRT